MAWLRMGVLAIAAAGLVAGCVPEEERLMQAFIDRHVSV